MLGKPASAHTKALVGFVVSYIIAIQYFRVVSSRDWGSYFFDPVHAFDRGYSDVRTTEADAFIDSLGHHSSIVKASDRPSLCLGISTIQRDDADYFKTLVGSLLEGLYDYERKDIYTMVLIANVDPNQHRDFKEPWLQRVADQILTYENISEAEKVHLRGLESPAGHKEKALYDYSYALQACYDTGAPYVIMFEDDVLAMDTWYSRAKNALYQVERHADFHKTLYLRLFYAHRFLGWNSEEWLTYLLWSISMEILLIAVLYTLRRTHMPSSRFLTFKTVLVILFICAPACIGLYFAAGRATVAGFPQGVHKMNKYACCSQTLTFPRDQIPALIEYFKYIKIGHRDSLAEKYADKNHLERFAVTPALFQHIGSRTSKFNGVNQIQTFGRNAAQNEWNFDFEKYDSLALRRHHSLLATLKTKSTRSS
nr:hypothetical protein CFP56_10280 [Quercus suber]